MWTNRRSSNRLLNFCLKNFFMEDIFSLLLYLGTFLCGFILDKKYDGHTQTKGRKLFVMWLYIFLCFGYMTGSDWRGYEAEYEKGDTYRYLSEPLSYLFLTALPNVIKDFWIALGLAKCVYLFVLLRFVKKLTPYYLSTTSLLLNISLCFMLISNPLRYMLALIPVTIALTIFIEIIFKEKEKDLRNIVIIVLLLCTAVLFHNVALFFLVLFPIIYVFRDITHYNRLLLLGAFLLTIIITSNIDLLNSIKDTVNLFLMSKGDIKEYDTYTAENNDAIFSIGNILKLIFFCIILYARDSLQSDQRSKFLYSVTIIYFFFDRFFLLIPTGFRLVIPLSGIYAALIIDMFHSTKLKKVGSVFIIYMFLAFSNSLWTSYDQIPYSNSIPYILTGHLDITERSNYNPAAYTKRTGESLDF